MNSLRSVDLGLIDEILRGSEKGYVLDFSNRTFIEFFVRELGIDIDAPDYAMDGTSKAKRLRCFLGKVNGGTAARTLRALWQHREALRGGSPDQFPLAAGQFAAIVAKLEGSCQSGPENVVAAPAVEPIAFDRFRTRLLEIADLQPHQRGYVFERFLKELFDAFGLNARDPLRLVGEPIDGSFELGSETYLVEAKWLNHKVGVAELGAFHSKLEQKASWTRELFISFGGFTDEGLQAFGRGRRIIGMDGGDLFYSLGRGIPVDRLISGKVRHAAETGEVFVPFERLFK